jgi:hypothetical protein
LLLHEPPKEEHALIGPYSQTRLKETIASFPELKHPMHVYVLIHKQSKEVVRTHDLAQFSKERNLPKAQIDQLKYGIRKSAKGWYLVPKENEKDPEAFLKQKLDKQAYGKQVFARRMFR